MIRLPHLMATAALLGAAAVGFPALAQTEAAPADTAAVLLTPEMTAGASEPATALDREVAGIRETFSARLADLTGRYRAAPDAAVAAALQRDITVLKQTLELDLLDLQLRLARERHDAAAISELEQSLTAARERLVADTGLEAPSAPAGDAAR